MKAIGTSGAGLSLLLLASAASAQEAVEPPRPSADAALKVQMVVNRHAGDKKVGSVAYSFPCNRDRKTVVKSGVEVPVPVRKAEAVEFHYRNVGTNIECESAAVAGGRYRLRISFEQSSLAGGDKTAPGVGTPDGPGAHPPSFRTSMSQFTALLREGQAAQVVSAADPLTGDVTAIEVTLTVLK